VIGPSPQKTCTPKVGVTSSAGAHSLAPRLASVARSGATMVTWMRRCDHADAGGPAGTQSMSVDRSTWYWCAGSGAGPAPGATQRPLQLQTVPAAHAVVPTPSGRQLHSQ
jgi:hypothetical protein